MRKFIYPLFIAALVCALSGFSRAEDNESYVIGDEDVLRVSVWGSPELTIQVPVRPDGMITVPPVGDVKAAGLTPKELKAVLEKELTKYVKAPDVSIVVTAINSFKVFVLGEGVHAATSGVTTGGPPASGASASGAITLKRATTLLQLLAQLGSLQDADLSNSYVLRNGKKLDVNLYKLVNKGDVSQDIQLRPNDVIFVPDNFDKRIMILGEVRTPRVIKFKEGMTVLDAILGSGGFTQFANPNNVTVIRKEGAQVRNVEVKLKELINNGKISSDIPLKPGDRIVVD
jgi:polysaccharide export outer membrane protein